VIVADGQVLLSTDYLYYTSPDITIVKRGWLGVPLGAAYEDVVSGRTDAVEVASGTALPPSTVVTWTYTVVSSEAGANPVIGADAANGQGVFGITVNDDILGPICTIASLDPNTSTGCLATGEVGPS